MRESGLFDFGFVSAQSQGFFEPAPSPKPRQKPKILAPNGCNIFSNARVYQNEKAPIERSVLFDGTKIICLGDRELAAIRGAFKDEQATSGQSEHGDGAAAIGDGADHNFCGIRAE